MFFEGSLFMRIRGVKTMIYELESSHFGLLNQLLQSFNIEYYNVLAAIFEGNNRAKIFVDDIETPKTALVWAINCMFYFIGDSENPNFNKYLIDTLNEVITPESLEMGADAFVCTLLHEEGWKERVEMYFADRKIEIGYRQEFSFDKELYYKRHHKEIPSYGCIKKIDLELIMSDHKGLLRDDICEFWYSVQDFIVKGVGFCLLVDDQVVSSCFSCYSSMKGLDININTYDDINRNKGYAELTAVAFIDYCIDNNLLFYWETYDNNAESIALAEKLGFEKSRKYLCYEFLFSEYSNQNNC